MASTLTLNTKVEQLYKVLENSKGFLATDSQRDVIPLLKSIYELLKLPTVRHHSTFPRLLSNALGQLLAFCGSHDQNVRLAAGDTLNKIIKALQQDHMSRILSELFQEIKKKGDSRVVRAAIARFSILCGRIRQQKCPQYGQQLLPVLLQLMCRQDDSLQDCLQDALPRMLLVFGTHYSEEELVQLAECCLGQLSSENPANRRTAAEALPLVCQNCLKPVKCTKWSIAHVVQGVLANDVRDHVICGLVLCLRQLVPLITMEMDDVMLLPKLYSLLLRCCLHGNHNVVTSALEALVVLLQQPMASLRVWLTLSLDHMTPMHPIGCRHGDSESTDYVTGMDDPEELTQLSPSPITRGDVTASVPPSGDNTQISTDGDVTAPLSPTGDDVSFVGGGGDDTQSVTEDSNQADGDVTAPVLPSGDDMSSPLSPADNDVLRPLYFTGDVTTPVPLTGDDITAPSPSSGETLSTSNTSSLSSSDTSSSPTFSRDDIPYPVPPSGDGTLLTPCDDHFVISLSATDVSVSVSPASARPSSHAPMLSCDLPHLDENSLGGVSTTTNSTPLNVLLQLLGTRLLTKQVKVSVKAVTIQCIVAIAAWNPQQLLVTIEAVEGSPKLIDLLLPYLESDDPKLCGTCCEVLSHYIKGALLWDTTTSGDHVIPVPSSVDHVIKVLSSKSATVLHNAIPSVKAFLPTLANSGCHSDLLDNVMATLVDLSGKVSYWLVRCDLLHVMTSLDHTLIRHTHQLAIFDYVIGCLSDGDHRVQDHAVDAVTRLVKCCCVAGLDHMIQAAQHLVPQHLNGFFYSATNVGKDHMIRPGLSIALHFVLAYCHGNLTHPKSQQETVGLVKCLRQLCQDYPPTQHMWHGQLSLISHLLNLMEGSTLAYDLCCHANMLFISSSLIVAMATKHLVSNPDHTKEWAAIGIPSLVAMVKRLFKHCIRCINICYTVLEEQTTDVVTKAMTTPTKPTNQKTQKSVKKEVARTPKHNHGNFTNIIHYMKLLWVMKNVYTVYQVTMETAKTDKFYIFLCATLGGVASLLDIALANDVAKYTEEICSYLLVLNAVEPWTGLLCVQQLLNALFGMNTAAHRVNILSPILLSHVTSGLNVSEPQPLLGDTLLTHPLDHMITSLTVHDDVGVADNSDGSHGSKPTQTLSRLRGLFSKKAASSLVMDNKPANSSAVIKDHIRHFEPLVVSAMKQFSSTTSILYQERTLFLIVQLLHLRVNYQLLDPSKLFLDSVLKLLTVIEEGHVRGSAHLIPYLFQFLVLLSWEQPKLMTIPEVMQRCDQVLVSGRNVSTYAIPSLQPLVVNLFMRTSLPLKGDQLEAEREVVLMMMLRLLGHHQVVNMCALVLECYHGNRVKWVGLSNQILPVLLPYLARFEVTMDAEEAIASLFRLMSVIAIETTNIRALFELLLSNNCMDTVGQYVMWVGLQCAVLRLVNRLLNDSKGDELLSALDGCSLATWPQVADHVISSSKSESSGIAMQLVEYYMESFHYCLSVLEWLHSDCMAVSHDLAELLAQLCFDWLLSLEYMIKSPYDLIWMSLRDHVIHNVPSFNDTWWTPVVAMTTDKSLLLIHFSQLLASLGYQDNLYWEWIVTKSSQSPYHTLLCHVSFLIMCSNELYDSLQYLLHHHGNQWVCLLDQLWTEPPVQRYWKGSHDPVPMLMALSSLDYDHMTALQITHCFRILSYHHNNHCDLVIPILCKHFIGCHVLAVAMAAQNTVVNKVKDKTWKDVLLLQQLIKDLPQSKQQRCTKLLESLCASKHEVKPATTGSCDQEWLQYHVTQYCHSNGSNSNICAQLLHQLPSDNMATIMKDLKFDSRHLVCCLATGIEQTRLSKIVPLAEVGPDVTRQPDKLLVVAKETLLNRLVSCDPKNNDLLLAILWLLLADPILGGVWQGSYGVAIINYVKKCLKECIHNDLIMVVSMLLGSHELTSQMDVEFIKEAISMAHILVLTENEPIKSPQDSIMKLLDINTDAVYRQLIVGLARLPLVNSHATASPTALQLDWEVGQELPNNLLAERDVVEEGLIKRTNQIGWLSRVQFEEVWVQSLSVLNMSVTNSNSVDHVMLIMRGIQSVTSLLLMATWRPEPGNPMIGSKLHTYRHRNIPFLDSKPGKHFTHMRQRIENDLLVSMVTRDDITGYRGYHTGDEDLQIHMYSNNVERKIGSHDLSYGQLSLHSLWSITHHMRSNENTVPQGRGEVDTRSCIVLLLDLFTQWLSGEHLHHVITCEIIRSVVMLSDLFFTAEQFDWMLLEFIAIGDQLASEDTIGHAHLIYGMLKCVAVLRMPGGSVLDHVIKSCDLVLQTGALLAQEACLRGLLYCMESADGVHVIPAISGSLCSYCLEHLKNFCHYNEQHMLLVWAVTMVMIECHSSEIHQENFVTAVVMGTIDILRSHDPPVLLHRAISHGLEQLLLTFSLTSEHRRHIAAVSIARLSSGGSSYSQTLSALGLLLCCVYTGEEGESLIGVTMDTTTLARERITCILEWFRRAPHPYTLVVTNILPQMMVDLLSPSEAVNMVMHEFLSQQQIHMTCAANMLVEVFKKTHFHGNSHVITSWMLLMIENALKREPVTMAIWYSCCLFIAASTNSVLQKMLPLITECCNDRPVVMDTFHHGGVHFYRDQLTVQDDRDDFIKILTQVSSLHHSYRELLAACTV